MSFTTAAAMPMPLPSTQPKGAQKKASRPSNTTTTTSTGILLSTYAQRDILCGRGGLTNRHAGNRLYRRLIQHNKPIYQALQNKHRQVCLIHSIFKAVQASGGRFLKKQGDQWEQLSDKQAYEKVKQAIREPDSKYAATCSIKSDQITTSSCNDEDASSSSTSSTASTFSQQESEEEIQGAENTNFDYDVNKMEYDDIDDASCFSDFTVEGPVAPLSRGTSTFLEDGAVLNMDVSIPFGKTDVAGLQFPKALAPSYSGTRPFAPARIWGRKPRKQALSLLLDSEDVAPEHSPVNIVRPTPTMASSSLPWEGGQQQSPAANTLGMFMAPQSHLPQICPCKVHQMNSNILAYNLQLQAFLEAQLKGHPPTFV